MEKKMPEIFQNKINKKLNNNEKVFYSATAKNDRQPNTNTDVNTGINIYQKINKIFSSPNYIYKAEVEIKLKDKNIKTKIIGRNKDFLITMDNQLIRISDILDITKKTN